MMTRQRSQQRSLPVNSLAFGEHNNPDQEFPPAPGMTPGWTQKEQQMLVARGRDNLRLRRENDYVNPLIKEAKDFCSPASKEALMEKSRILDQKITDMS